MIGGHTMCSLVRGSASSCRIVWARMLQKLDA